MPDHPHPLRFGVLGLGVIGALHVQRLCSAAAARAGAELVAVADEDTDRAKSVADEFGVDATGSAGELFARGDLDAVIIAVPSGLHADLTVAALDAGRHVLLEKPIDITVDAADRIIEAESRSGRTLSIVSQRRFAPENRFVFDAVRDGLLGRVTSATVEVALWRSQEYYDSGAWRGTWALDGGGALMNQGVHLVDLALWLLGDVEEVHAYAGTLAHERIEVEDTIAITARLAGGALLTFLATTAAFDSLPIRYTVLGASGSVVVENEALTHYVSTVRPTRPDVGAEDVDQQLAQLEDFLRAVRTGSAPLVTSVQARAAVSFIEAAYESARTGRAVRTR